MNFDNNFSRHFARLFGVTTVILTSLYWAGVLPLPHPEWTNMTVRIGLPMCIGWIFILFDIATIKTALQDFVKKKWL